MNQNPEEKESGLVRVGNIYMSVDTPEAELYVHIIQGNKVTAYRFCNPTYFWKLVLLRCDQSRSFTADEINEHL